MSKAFDAYAAYYDLLYQQKDYAGEAAYLHSQIQRYAPSTQEILELGCGTGAHAAHLAGLGYNVQGIDISEKMLLRADSLSASLPKPTAARLHFEHGDVRSWHSPRRFDAVLSLFHVFSYQISDTDIKAAFQTAATHLRKDGVLIIDFWYGPAVVAIRPEARIKKMEDGFIRLTRTAEPEHYPVEHRVDVLYDVLVENRSSGDKIRFSETHKMRYFFVPELESLLHAVGLELVNLREWLSDKPPSTESWSVMLLARRIS